MNVQNMEKTPGKCEAFSLFPCLENLLKHKILKVSFKRCCIFIEKCQKLLEF